MSECIGPECDHSSHKGKPRVVVVDELKPPKLSSAAIEKLRKLGAHFISGRSTGKTTTRRQALARMLKSGAFGGTAIRRGGKGSTKNRSPGRWDEIMRARRFRRGVKPASWYVGRNVKRRSGV